ncbi:hypothetical protein FA106_23045, partial [Pseudomonas aeruginosa]|nr:hypothetical protein [Pseudomonas aeruginosa]
MFSREAQSKAGWQRSTEPTGDRCPQKRCHAARRPGSRVQGPGSRVQGPGSRVQGANAGEQPGARPHLGKALLAPVCGFHAIRPPSPLSSGQAFHGHLAT